MLEIVNRAVLDWRLLIQAKAWKCKKFYPVRGGNEKLPSYNCNFAELRQFFKSEWCQLCLQMNRSSLSAVMILKKLEAELAGREQLVARMTHECEEFEAYFPETSLRTIPDSVWSQVHAGVPLAAAYALYERGIQNQKKKDEQREARAASCLAGLPGAGEEHYFSPAQVRAMSRREVRENYDRIFESMRHWQ
jgi:hypothetical protein